MCDINDEVNIFIYFDREQRISRDEIEDMVTNKFSLYVEVCGGGTGKDGSNVDLLVIVPTDALQLAKNIGAHLRECSIAIKSIQVWENGHNTYV